MAVCSLLDEEYIYLLFQIPHSCKHWLEWLLVITLTDSDYFQWNTIP